MPIAPLADARATEYYWMLKEGARTFSGWSEGGTSPKLLRVRFPPARALSACCCRTKPT